jgi:kumamolisin
MDAERTIDVTILLRHPAASGAMAEDLLAGRSAGGTRAEIEGRLSADPRDLEAVSTFAARNGLRVTESNAVKRAVHVQGTARQMEAAFGVTLQERPGPDGRPLPSYSGKVTLPQDISDIVTAVLGLNQEPVAKFR